jgi:tetratricopeptide (TPR) repeat protein
VKDKTDSTPSSTMLSFNANLYPALRYTFVGHQWLLRGKLDEARRSLQASLAKGVTEEARIEQARVDALAGDLDAAREEVKSVLAERPDNFEALSVFAYIEIRFQDYRVAAELYRRGWPCRSLRLCARHLQSCQSSNLMGAC